MTRTELIAALAKETEMEKKETKIFLEAVTTLVEKTLKKGGEVPFKGLGKFKVQKRKARMGRNPRTGEPVQIKASNAPAFKAGKALKDAVN